MTPKCGPELLLFLPGKQILEMTFPKDTMINRIRPKRFVQVPSDEISPSFLKQGCSCQQVWNVLGLTKERVMRYEL
jgi:hypothetical protein